MAGIRRVDRLYVDLRYARPGSVGAYLIAAVLVIIATLIRLALDPWLPGAQFITYIPAVLIAALLSGMAAGFAAALFAAAAAWYFVLPPARAFGPVESEVVVALALFLVVAGATVLIVGAMRAAVARYRDLSFTLKKRVEQRTEELRRAQATLVQVQKMEAVGQLTGGIAHDFNNMLAIVLGNLDLAQRRLRDGRTDIFRHIDNALDGARRAAALTQRLLVFARRQPLEPAVVDVNRLLGDLAELLRRTLGETIRVECARGRGTWPICADPGQLESAIINLAVNARDAMESGGTLRLASANVRGEEAVAAAALPPGDYVAISVADTGVGMAPEIVARAMEPFFTTKEVGRGTGLGLSQVYGFARQSGGGVGIDSEVGRGTSVSLYFPRHEGREPAGTASADAETVPNGRRGEVVLVVEDEDAVRRTSIEALDALGYGVREARTGIEALAILANDPAVDLLFTDIVMPGLDGRELCRRALRQRPDLKLLYTTGYSPEGEGAAEGLVLQKPFTYDQLARKVREALDVAAPAAD